MLTNVFSFITRYNNLLLLTFYLYLHSGNSSQESSFKFVTIPDLVREYRQVKCTYWLISTTVSGALCVKPV